MRFSEAREITAVLLTLSKNKEKEKRKKKGKKEKENISVGVHSDVYVSIWFILDMMIENIEICILILV